MDNVSGSLFFLTWASFITCLVVGPSLQPRRTRRQWLTVSIVLCCSQSVIREWFPFSLPVSLSLPLSHHCFSCVCALPFLRIVFQVKIWFQNRRSKYKKMAKACASGSGGNNSNQGGQSGSSGPGGASTPLKFEDQTPTSTSTPQTPPETPEGVDSPPSHHGNNGGNNNNNPLVSPSSMMSESNGGNNGGQGMPLSGSHSSAVSPPSSMSPQGLSWDHPHMMPHPSKVPNHMTNSYIPQYAWHHHAYDPNMNPHQLLT